MSRSLPVLPDPGAYPLGHVVKVGVNNTRFIINHLGRWTEHPKDASQTNRRRNMIISAFLANKWVVTPEEREEVNCWIEILDGKPITPSVLSPPTNPPTAPTTVPNIKVPEASAEVATIVQATRSGAKQAQDHKSVKRRRTARYTAPFKHTWR